MTTFGDILSHYRKKKGLTQRQLARRVQVAPSYLNEIENGQRTSPSQRIVRSLAKQLGVPLEAFHDATAREKLQLPPDLAPYLKTHPEILNLLRTMTRCQLSHEGILSMKNQIEKGFTKAIIVAAGKGARMKHMTQTLPKCLAIRIGGKSLLEIQMETLRQCGVQDIVVIRGYKGEKINLPGARYLWNKNFETNNVLESLFCAARELEGNVIISYSDIWYEKSVLENLLKTDQDIALAVDIDWKETYEGRREHPLSEAENVVFDGQNRLIKIGKLGTSNGEVHGEFMGLAKLTPAGCRVLKTHYERAKQLYDNKSFQRAPLFRQAYLTDLLQEMADLGVSIHCQITGSQWREIDTLEDLEKVQQLLGE